MNWNTVSPQLKEVLEACMRSSVFDGFRLVGGTSLSLQLGDRISMDIDLFTDATYDSKDFSAIEQFFRDHFAYVDVSAMNLVGMGKSFFVGHSKQEAVKVDVYYTDPFIREPHQVDGIIMASVEDIIAMKLDVIGRGGRKKDFWDLHACHDRYTIAQMIALYVERYPYNFTEAEIRNGLLDFSSADNDFDPVDMSDKHWELIKLDFLQWVATE